MPEARLEDSGCGLAPASDGWFVVNVRDTQWWVSKAFGSGCNFDTREFAFPQLGINVTVMEPGQPTCLYHSENQQEDFLVLAGECLLLVDGEERPLKAWDFVHLPSGVEHVFVGAGEGPCIVLMTGARTPDEEILYPKSEFAARYGASAKEETPEPKQAYAPYEPPERARPAYWDSLPWAQPVRGRTVGLAPRPARTDPGGRSPAP